MSKSCLLRCLMALFLSATWNSWDSGERRLRAAEPAGQRAFVDAHCSTCHNASEQAGHLNLEDLAWEPQNSENFARWVRIYDRVRTREMPPPDSDQPAARDRQTFQDGLDKELHRFSAQQLAAHGRTSLRRLNRVEYEQTLHDLLQIDAPLRHLLPEDTPAHGFDTVAEGLRFSPLQIEKLLETTDVALEAALQLGPRPETIQKRFTYKDEKGIRENLDTPEGAITDPVSKAKHQVIFRELPDAVVFFSDGYSPTDLKQFSSQTPGHYRIRISGYGFQSGGKHVMLRVYSSNYREKRLLGDFDMPPDQPREVEIQTRLGHNEHLIIVPYDTGYDAEGKNIWQSSGSRFTGAGLAVQWVEIEGPLLESWPPPSVKAIFGDTPLVELPANQRPWRNGQHIAYTVTPAAAEKTLRPLLTRFAERAFRRPLRPQEANGFIKLAETHFADSKNFDEAVLLGIRAILTAPQCLLLEEEVGLLNDYALAARLSYFLWSAPPDQELLLLAKQKQLTQPNVLRSQVARMLESPRSQALVTNFTGQWLDLRKIDATSPDAQLYPEFDEMLKNAMVAETEAFFRELVTKDLPVRNLIDSSFVTVNRRMAEHYGIPGVVGEQFLHVTLPKDSPRGGLLTQASVLKVTANGTVTSPVMRGAWVMKRLMGETPPPPPPVAAIEPDTRGATTIREQLAKHRHSPTCNSCHRTIDPPGFALESFDVIGGWREHYRSIGQGQQPPYKLKGQNIWQYKLGPQVDATGTLPDGRNFSGIREFKQQLLDREEQVLRCVTENLLVYGTGAGLTFADRKAVNAIMQRTTQHNGGLRTLITEVVLSETFRSK